MSGSLNRVILVGNLGQDPDVRSLSSGDKVANLSVATSERWKDRDGNKQERTEWHRISIFGKTAEVAERCLRKGSKVLIEGQLQTRKWQDQQGNDRYSTEVVVRPFSGRLTMLDSKPGGDAGSSSYGDTYDSETGYSDSSQQRDYSADLDSEIPF